MSGHIGFKAFSGAVAIDATSAPLEKTFHPVVSVIGTTSASAIITLQESEDGVTWVDGPATAAGTSHRLQAWSAVKHVRVKSSAAVTANIWIAAEA